MQLGDDFQVGSQHPQLGRRAQFQLATFVNVERLVGVVGLYPHTEAFFAALEQREAVAHVAGLLRREHAVAEQTDRLGEGRIGQAHQVFADLALQITLQRRTGGEVQPVQVIQRQAEQTGQAHARHGDALGGFDGLNRRVAIGVLRHDALAQRGIAQDRVDDAAVGQQANMAVGQGRHFLAARAQVIGGPALSDQQRQYLTQRQATGLLVDRFRAARIEQAVDLAEVGTEPEPQAVGDTVHFAVTRCGGKRHAVEVVTHDALAGGERLRAFAVGPYAGGDHLPDLFLRITGAPLGGVTILFHLSGQGAAASGLAAEAQALFQLADGSLGEPWPVHRRVGVRPAGVEQATILDEQQAHHHERGDVLETFVVLAWIAVGIERQPTAVVDRQPGLGFFRVGREEAAAGVIQQRAREARLFLDAEIALHQPFDEIR